MIQVLAVIILVVVQGVPQIIQVRITQRRIIQKRRIRITLLQTTTIHIIIRQTALIQGKTQRMGNPVQRQIMLQ